MENRRGKRKLAHTTYGNILKTNLKKGSSDYLFRFFFNGVIHLKICLNVKHYINTLHVPNLVKISNNHFNCSHNKKFSVWFNLLITQTHKKRNFTYKNSILPDSQTKQNYSYMQGSISSQGLRFLLVPQLWKLFDTITAN